MAGLLSSSAQVARKLGVPDELPQEEAPSVITSTPIERLVLPSPDQLVEAESAKLKLNFAEDFEVPEPPQELFETLESFAAQGIRRFDNVYYQPDLQLKENDKFWKKKGVVKPNPYFWQQIKDGNFPKEVNVLTNGWFIGDRRVKPMYQNGQQMYEDDYLASYMAFLRGSGKIQLYEHVKHVPVNSRFGASPQEIEEVILPEFARISGAKGIVRNRRFIEFNIRGNIDQSELGQTTTWEWFGDPVFGNSGRLVGGRSDYGGLAYVSDGPVDYRDGYMGFSPVVEFPSK